MGRIELGNYAMSTTYQILTNAYTTQPAYPGDNDYGRTIVSDLDADTLNAWAADGWEVVSVSWRETEVVAALLRKVQP